MKATTVSDFRSKMKEHLDKVENDQDFLIVSGPKQKDFVVLTLEMFNSIQETAHLLSNSANTNRLMESIKEDVMGKTVSRPDENEILKRLHRIESRDNKLVKVTGKRTLKKSSSSHKFHK